MYLSYSVWFHGGATLKDKNYGIIHYSRNRMMYVGGMREYNRRMVTYLCMEGLVRNGAGQHNSARFYYAVCTLPYHHLTSDDDDSNRYLSVSFVVEKRTATQDCMTRGLTVV